MSCANIRDSRRIDPQVGVQLRQILHRQLKRSGKAGVDSTSWPRCTGCNELLIADPGDELICNDCRDPKGAEIRRAVAKAQLEVSPLLSRGTDRVRGVMR